MPVACTTQSRYLSLETVFAMSDGKTLNLMMSDSAALTQGRGLKPMKSVIVSWPSPVFDERGVTLGQRDAVCVLTHDPKFDVPVLQVALREDLAYVGAMGSRRTHDDRLARLREAGMTEKELARLSSPIGLDLGARTPEETAVSIAAEIIAGRWGGGGARLATTEGRIHHDIA